VRPLGVLPLSARCKPRDVRFEDGEAASGPPLDAKMWGACETVRRLNAINACDEGGSPDSCPPLEGPYENWLYGAMLRRTFSLLGGSAWGKQLISDWWACDSQAADARACAAVNASAPAWTRHANAAPAHAGVDGDDQPVVGDEALLTEPLLLVDGSKSLAGQPPRSGGGGSGGDGSAPAARSGGEGRAAHAGAIVAAAATAAIATLA
jgi:hypothetical protein